jgi:hypothetical protein
MYIDNQTEDDYPSEPLRLRSRILIQNFVFRSRDFVYLSHFVALRSSSLFALRRSSLFVARRPLSHFVTLCRLSPFVACHTSSRRVAPYRSSSLLVVSSRILLGILFIYIFSLFSHSSHRLLKKGLTSTCTFLTFCRFIPLQAYQRCRPNICI